MALPFSFLGRNEELRQVLHIALSNYSQRLSGSKSAHTFVLVPGAPGIGKTRFAHELQFRLKHDVQSGMDPSFVAALQNPLYLLIDFNNGMQFQEALDLHYSPTVCIGVRLLRAYFGGKLELLVRALAADLGSITTDAVLSRIIAEERKSKGPNATICLIIHIDEFQILIEQYEQHGFDLRLARSKYKELLKEIGRFMMRVDLSDFDPNAFILPVCSGISLADTVFLSTEYGQHIVRLPPLTHEEAMKMAAERYAADPAWPATAELNAFQVALSDTGTSLLPPSLGLIDSSRL